LNFGIVSRLAQSIIPLRRIILMAKGMDRKKETKKPKKKKP